MNEYIQQDIGFLSRLFKLSNKEELKEKIDKGALLLDVRTREEFDDGHAKGSVHMINYFRASLIRPMITDPSFLDWL